MPNDTERPPHLPAVSVLAADNWADRGSCNRNWGEGLAVCADVGALGDAVEGGAEIGEGTAGGVCGGHCGLTGGVDHGGIRWWRGDGLEKRWGGPRKMWLEA